MKRLNRFTRIAAIATYMVLVALLLFSCNNYNETVVADFNQLKCPIVLLGKNESVGSYNISVIDGTGHVSSYGNASYFANGIGVNYNVGDTLKHCN